MVNKNASAIENYTSETFDSLIKYIVSYLIDYEILW